MTKNKKQDRIPAGLCTLILMILLVLISATAGCTGSADDITASENTGGTEEEIAIKPAFEEEFEIIDINDVIAIDLVSMYQDIQNKNPLAFDYVILPTRYTGLNDNGDYEFEGVINNFSKGGDVSNYIGVLFTEKDEESETGYHEWINKGLKFDTFGGEDDQNITIKFIVDKEDIPEGKTIIMSGYDLYRI